VGAEERSHSLCVAVPWFQMKRFHLYKRYQGY
jgi:hypothetical protein